MPDIETAPTAAQFQQGVVGRLRNLFTRQEQQPGPTNTPQQRRKQMEIEAKDDTPLTGQSPLPRRDIEDFKAQPPKALSPEQEAAPQHDMDPRRGTVLDLGIDPRSDEGKQAAPFRGATTDHEAKKPLTEREATEALLKEKADAEGLQLFEQQLKTIRFAKITVVSGHTIEASRSLTDRNAPARYKMRPATMIELRPLIEGLVKDLAAQRQSAPNDTARQSFRIDDGNATTSRLTISFDRAPQSREKPIAALPNLKGNPVKESYDFFHGHRTKVEQFLEQNATPEETAAFQKQLTETGHATLTLITAETITATRDEVILGQVQYNIRPATVEEYKPHIERLERAFASRNAAEKDQSTYSGNSSDQASLPSLGEQIHVQHEPIDPELSDAYYDDRDSGPSPAVQAQLDAARLAAKLDLKLNPKASLEQSRQRDGHHACGPNCNCAASSGSRKQGLQQALIELAVLQGAEHTTDATGNAVLTGRVADAVLRAVQVQATAAEAAIGKALRDSQRRAELEDATLDVDQPVGSKEPIALKLTEEQVQLLVSNEYPNEPEKASQSVFKLIRDGEPINILKESVELDYSEDIKGFYARLDEAERPSLLSKIQDLEKQDERQKRAPEQQRQKSRSRDQERV